jgi:hypothetical protein
MTKQRNSVGSTETPEEIRRRADGYLAEIAARKAELLALNSAAIAAVQKLEAEYNAKKEPLNILLNSAVLALMQTMKIEKKTLFDGTDIVRLVNGSLIHSTADKVSIPRDALAKCEELGYAEVVKIAKSLDRDAVEKWPDERLILIGAERKSKEEFSYDLAEVKP